MANTSPDDTLVWGIAFLIGCIFLFAMPKVILVIVIAGLCMGFVGSGVSGGRRK